MYLMSLGEFAPLLVSLVQGVLDGLVVLVHQEVQGSSITRRSPPSGGPPFPSGGPPPGYPPLPGGLPFLWDILLQEVLYQDILLSQGSPTLVWISPSLRGSLISMQPSIIIIIAISSWIFPPSCHGSPLHICASLGGFSFC